MIPALWRRSPADAPAGSVPVACAQRRAAIRTPLAGLVPAKLVQGKLVQGKLVQGKLVQGKLVQAGRAVAGPVTAGLLAAGLLLAAPRARAQAFDPVHTRIGFELYTRWGRRLEGRFPRYEGAVRSLPDGRQQVSMRLSTADVEILGHPRYGEFARGHRFFDARRHPWISFTSDPYPPSLLREGGRLSGLLRIHGVGQHESFTVEPAACARPALACDLVAHGSVRREDYGMDDWPWAVRARVRFELRLRLRPETVP